MPSWREYKNYDTRNDLEFHSSAREDETGRLYDKDDIPVFYTDGACKNNGYSDARAGCGVFGGSAICKAFRSYGEVFKNCK